MYIKEVKNVMMNVVMMATCIIFIPVVVLLVWMLLFLSVAIVATEKQMSNILSQYIAALIGMAITVGLFQLILKPTKHLVMTIKEMSTRKKWIEETQREIEDTSKGAK